MKVNLDSIKKYKKFIKNKSEINEKVKKYKYDLMMKNHSEFTFEEMKEIDKIERKVNSLFNAGMLCLMIGVILLTPLVMLLIVNFQLIAITLSSEVLVITGITFIIISIFKFIQDFKLSKIIKEC